MRLRYHVFKNRTKPDFNFRIILPKACQPESLQSQSTEAAIVDSIWNRCPDAGPKIKMCFFKADELKMANCAPASAAAQHNETPVKGQH